MTADTTTGKYTPAWRRKDHWQEGDTALVVTFRGDHDTTEDTVTVRLHAGQAILPYAGGIRPQTFISDYPATGWAVLHPRSCPSCAALLNGTRLYRDTHGGYWGHWSPEAHARSETLEDCISWTEDRVGLTSGTFTAEADVPDWLREVTAGLLRHSQSPTLAVARVFDEIDWPTLLERNPGNPVVAIGPYGQGPDNLTWPMVVNAYRIPRAAGKPAVLDLDIEVMDQPELALLPSILWCPDLNTALDHELITRVNAALDGQTRYDAAYGHWMWC